jgi:hypothetical protein
MVTQATRPEGAVSVRDERGSDTVPAPQRRTLLANSRAILHMSKFLHRALVATLSLLEICPRGNHMVVDPNFLHLSFLWVELCISSLVGVGVAAFGTTFPTCHERVARS